MTTLLLYAGGYLAAVLIFGLLVARSAKVFPDDTSDE